MAENNKIMVGAGSNTFKVLDPSTADTLPSVADKVIIFDDSDNLDPKVTTLRDIISLGVY